MAAKKWGLTYIGRVTGAKLLVVWPWSDVCRWIIQAVAVVNQSIDSKYFFVLAVSLTAGFVANRLNRVPFWKELMFFFNRLDVYLCI